MRLRSPTKTRKENIHSVIYSKGLRQNYLPPRTFHPAEEEEKSWRRRKRVGQCLGILMQTRFDFFDRTKMVSEQLRPDKTNRSSSSSSNNNSSSISSCSSLNLLQHLERKKPIHFVFPSVCVSFTNIQVITLAQPVSLIPLLLRGGRGGGHSGGGAHSALRRRRRWRRWRPPTGCRRRRRRGGGGGRGGDQTKAGRKSKNVTHRQEGANRWDSNLNQTNVATAKFFLSFLQYWDHWDHYMSAGPPPPPPPPPLPPPDHNNYPHHRGPPLFQDRDSRAAAAHRPPFLGPPSPGSKPRGREKIS